MKPTNDDFEPRRDGWFEHQGVWGEVTIGTVLATKKRSQRWEVIDMAHGQQVEHGHTLWMKIREQTTGEEAALQPRSKVARVTILTQDPADTETPPIMPPSDSETLELLVRELGAEVMATRDYETGEITCPDYIWKSHLPQGYDHVGRGLIEHMRFAHQMPVDDGLDIKTATTLHGQAHNPKWPNIGKGGFAHRHVPEDLSLM